MSVTFSVTQTQTAQNASPSTNEKEPIEEIFKKDHLYKLKKFDETITVIKDEKTSLINDIQNHLQEREQARNVTDRMEKIEEHLGILNECLEEDLCFWGWGLFFF